MASSEIEPFEFVGAGGATLSGLFHQPPGATRGVALLAHCFTCSKDLITSSRLAKGLAAEGWATLRFDFTGLGESDGDFATTTLATDIGDLSRAAMSLIELGRGPCRLIGHSLGGAAVVLAAHRLKTVEAVVTLAAPSAANHVRHLFDESIEEIETAGCANVLIGGRPFPVTTAFVDELDNHDVRGAVAELNRPYLAVHAKDDTIVSFANAQELVEAAAEPKKLVALEEGGHMFASREASGAVLSNVLEFFESV